MEEPGLTATLYAAIVIAVVALGIAILIGKFKHCAPSRVLPVRSKPSLGSCFLCQVGGIDSIAECHWTIDSRHSIFIRLQRNSQNDDISAP